MHKAELNQIMPNCVQFSGKSSSGSWDGFEN